MLYPFPDRYPHPNFRGLGLINQLLRKPVEIATNRDLTRSEREFNGDLRVPGIG